MSKKRDRRSAASSTRRDNRIEQSTGRDDSASDCKLVTIFILFFIVAPVISVIVYRFRFSSPSYPKESYVYQRGLVTTDANYQDVLTVSTNSIPLPFIKKRKKKLQSISLSGHSENVGKNSCFLVTPPFQLLSYLKFQVSYSI